MRLLIGFLLIVIFAVPAFCFPSLALKELWDIPLEQVNSKTIKSYRQDLIQVEEITYQSRPYNGKPVKIFGYFCYPYKAQHKLPTLLIVHGGGGSAYLDKTLRWAKQGYAVLAIDLPGKGERRQRSRSSGPNMDVAILLRSKPDPSYNYLVHAVAATRNGITYLTQRSEVDKERIGMVGLSWGGVITLLTNGQDKRLKTAVNVFGAGYIPEGCTWQKRFTRMDKDELEGWHTYIDPKNFLKTQHAPILFITGTNDHCYYLPTFQKSFAEVAVAKKLLLIPNLRHQFASDMQKTVFVWLNNKLKKEGSFPIINLLATHRKGGNKLIIPAQALSDNKIEDVKLYYSQAQPSGFTKIKWQALNSHYENGIYYFGIPTAMIKPDLMFYITAKDKKGAAVSTPVRSIFLVDLNDGNKTYAVSSAIKHVNKHEPPFYFVDFLNLPKNIKVAFSKQNQAYYIPAMQTNKNVDKI